MVVNKLLHAHLENLDRFTTLYQLLQFFKISWLGHNYYKHHKKFADVLNDSY